ncbi:NB-ARC domain-containing protein [Actinomadura napierensis]|uniref:NB-ARC domain-containing protein n=1 Tax=Actinomadura napierensis TaxID=267854 RepID=A0ABN3A7A9_9ACTN
MEKVFGWLTDHMPAWLLASLLVFVALIALGVFLAAFWQGRALTLFGVSIGARLGKGQGEGDPETPADQEVESLRAGDAPPSLTVSPPTVPSSNAPPSPEPTLGNQAIIEPPRTAPAQPAAPRLAGWERLALVSHDKTFGIAHLIREVAEVVRAPGGAAVVGLSGDGGIGKTTLAYEVARQCDDGAAFTEIVWASAKDAHMSVRTAGDGVIGTINWQDVVRSIVLQLGADPGPNSALWDRQLSGRLGQAGEHERFLLVLDNLENLQDAEATVDKLLKSGFSRPHKVLVTTRFSLPLRNLAASRNIAVPPLSERAAMELIRHVGDLSNAITQASQRDLARIVETAEGNPYLIKLIVGLYQEEQRPLKMVIDELIEQGRRSENPDDAGAQVRDYLYTQSLERLEHRFNAEIQESLIAAFRNRPKGDAVKYEDLKQLSGISDDEVFGKALTMACRLNLVRVTEPDKRYSIHSLLYEFLTG